ALSVASRPVSFCLKVTATTDIYTLSLHDALPIWPRTPYFNYSTFIASPIVSEETVFVEDQEYTFYLDEKYFLNNEYIDIKQIRRSEEHTSELQSRENLVCRLLLEKKKKTTSTKYI